LPKSLWLLLCGGFVSPSQPHMQREAIQASLHPNCLLVLSLCIKLLAIPLHFFIEFLYKINNYIYDTCLAVSLKRIKQLPVTFTVVPHPVTPSTFTPCYPSELCHPAIQTTTGLLPMRTTPSLASRLFC